MVGTRGVRSGRDGQHTFFPVRVVPFLITSIPATDPNAFTVNAT